MGSITKALKVSERYYKEFVSNEYKHSIPLSSKTYTLEILWEDYGLHDINDYQFSIQTKINCLQEWCDLLNNEPIDVQSLYDNLIEEFNLNAQKATEKYPHLHINFKRPTIQNLLNKISNSI